MTDMKMTDQIRKLIDKAPISRHRICILAGLDQANLTQFMAGKRGMSQETLDAIGEVLKFKVTMDMERLRKMAKKAPRAGRPAGSPNKPKVEGEVKP